MEVWAENETSALTVGVDYEAYWGDNMTPKLLQKYFDAYHKRLKDQMLVNDITNYSLGKYIRTAVGDVLSGKNRYPRKPYMLEEEPKLKRTMSKDETEAYLAKMAKEQENE